MLVIITGKSASGKDTIKNELVKNGFIPIVGHTTRPMRDTEQQDREYHFLKDEEWNENNFIESRLYKTKDKEGNEVEYKFGTPKKELDTDKNYVCIKESMGAKTLQDYYGKDNTLTFYIDAPYRIRTQRAYNRALQSPDFNEKKWEIEWDNRRVTDEREYSDTSYADIIFHNYSMQQGIEYDFDKTMKGFIDLCTTWCEMKQNSNETPNLENLLDTLDDR